VRIVLVTSVLISALRSEQGAAAEVIRRVMLGELTVLMDHKIAYEYRDVAFRARQLHVAGKSREQTADILNLIEAQAEAVRVYFMPRPLSTDPNDDMVLDVAINGRADAIVTFNTKHFESAAAQFNIDVVRPAELLTRIRSRR
jgi:putative PIN family toxin of toxin-antitoxin system